LKKVVQFAFLTFGVWAEAKQPSRRRGRWAKRGSRELPAIPSMDASSYEQVVPKDHFLVKLNEIIPWQRFTYKLVKYYKGKAKEGRPPYDPAVLLSHRDPVGKPGGEIFPGLRGR